MSDKKEVEKKKETKKVEKKDITATEIYEKIGRILLVTLLVVILTFLFATAVMFNKYSKKNPVHKQEYQIVIVENGK